MNATATTTAIIPHVDLDFLNEKGWRYEIAPHPGEVRIYIRDFQLPAAYTPQTTDLLIRLPLGYSQANPDMFWTKPDVRLAGGGYPNRADYHDPSADNWQRWSRHSSWRPGIDNLRSKMASVKRELEAGT
jgi:hypothetical protein